MADQDLVVAVRRVLPSSVLTAMLWCLTGLLVLNTLGNVRGRHAVERWGAGGVTGLLAVLCAVLAAS